MENKITFTTEDNEQIDFFVIEETKINGNNYLLVSENEEEDESIGYIMKEINDGKKGSEVSYMIVSDESELAAVAEVFDELVDEVTIE